MKGGVGEVMRARANAREASSADASLTAGSKGLAVIDEALLTSAERNGVGRRSIACITSLD
jgi:hypothetical protein